MSTVKTIVEHNGVQYTAHVASIERTFLGVDDHGIVTATMSMRWDSSGISLGGYVLDAPERDEDGKHLGRIGTAYGMDHIMRILEAVGVDSWEQVKGSRVFILFEGEGGWGSSAAGLAHLTSGKVLIFKEHSERWKAREGE